MGLAVGRFWEIDALRGIAIIMMVLFHFMWDLNYFGFVQVSLYTGFFGLFQKATAGLFLLLVGTVLTISYNRNRENFLQKFLKRGLIVFSGGLALTVITFFLFPERFIYFGILHLIGVSIILSIPLIKKTYFNLSLAILLVLTPVFFDFSSLNAPFLVWMGLAAPSTALDFSPVIPWFGAVLFGIFLGNIFYKHGAPKLILKKPGYSATNFLMCLGRNSLLIYFLHQPIIFGSIYLASLFI